MPLSQLENQKQDLSRKKQLKNIHDKIFVTEALTKYRQKIVSEIIQTKKAFGHSMANIYVKLDEDSNRHEITALHELN